MDRPNNHNFDDDDTNIDADIAQPTAQHTSLTDTDERNDTTNNNEKTPESKHDMTDEIQQLKDKVEEYQSLYRKSMDEIDALRREISDMKEQAETDARERDELRTKVECLQRDLERFISLAINTQQGGDKPLTRKRSFVKRVLSAKAKKGQKLSEVDETDVSTDNNDAPKKPQEKVKEVEKERQRPQAEGRSNSNDNVPIITTQNKFSLRRVSVDNNNATPKKNQEPTKDDCNVPITTQNKFSLRRVSVDNNVPPKKPQEHVKDDCSVPITTTQNKFSLRRVSTEPSVKDVAEKERQPPAEGRLNLRNIFNFGPADSTCSATTEGESVGNDNPEESKDREMTDDTTKETPDVDEDDDPDEEEVEEDRSVEETTATKDSNEEEETVEEQPVEETTATPAPMMGLWGIGQRRAEEKEELPQEAKGFGLFRFQQQPQPQPQQDKGTDPAEDNHSEISAKPVNEDSSEFPPPRGLGSLFKRASVKTQQSVKFETNPELTTDTTEDNESAISSKVSVDDASDVTPPRGLGSLFKRASVKTQQSVKFETNPEVVIDRQQPQPEVEDNESEISSKVSIEDSSDVTPPRGIGSLFKRASVKSQQSVKFATNPEVMTVKVDDNVNAVTAKPPETTTTSKVEEPSNTEASNDTDDHDDDSPAVETIPESNKLGLAAFFQQSQASSQDHTPQEDPATDEEAETDDTPTDQPPTSESPDDSPTDEPPPPATNDASSQQPPPNNNIFSLRHLIRTPSQMPPPTPDNKSHPEDNGNNTPAESNDNRPPHWRQKSGGLQGLFQFKPSQRAPFSEPIDEASVQDFNDPSSEYWYYNKEDTSDDDDDKKDDDDDDENDDNDDEGDGDDDNDDDDGEDDDQLLIGFPEARKRSVKFDEPGEMMEDRPSMTSLEASAHSRSSWSLQLTM